jgi:hypothetical protein
MAEETRNAHRILEGMPFRSWENNINVDLTDERWKVDETGSGLSIRAGFSISCLEASDSATG